MTIQLGTIPIKNRVTGVTENVACMLANGGWIDDTPAERQAAGGSGNGGARRDDDMDIPF
jgi:hypothetical protein